MCPAVFSCASRVVDGVVYYGGGDRVIMATPALRSDRFRPSRGLNSRLLRPGIEHYRSPPENDF